MKINLIIASLMAITALSSNAQSQNFASMATWPTETWPGAQVATWPTETWPGAQVATWPSETWPGAGVAPSWPIV